MSFNSTIKWFFVSSAILLIVLSIYQSNKPVNFITDNLYVLEVVNSQEDRLIKTNNVGVTKSVIYEGKKIQNFGVNQGKLLIATGQKNKKSTIELINLSDKSTKLIELGDQYVSKIIPVNIKFVFLYEEVSEGFRAYKAKIGIIDIATMQISNPNPSFLANDVAELYANREGTLAVFSGFNGYKYLLDLVNTDNIVRIPTGFNFTANFINQKTLVAGLYNNENIMFIDLVTNNVEKKTLESKYFESILATNNGNLFYTIKNGDEYSSLYRLTDLNKSINFVSSSESFKDPIIDNKEQYLAFKKISNETIQIEKDYSKVGTINSQILVYDTKSKQVQNSGLMGIKYQFEF